MRSASWVAAAFAVVFGGATLAPGTADAVAPARTVHIKNFAFVPARLRVHVGERVRFVNDDDEAHTVTATDKSFDSAGLDSEKSWEHAFSKAGAYAYFCELHPYMTGAIEVTP